MKPFAFLAILLAISLSANAQFTNLKKATALKSGKLIVGYSGILEQDEYLKENVDKYWKFTPIVDYLPIKEAYVKAKEDPSYFIITIDELKGSSTTETGETVDNYSTELSILTSNRGMVIDHIIGKEEPTNFNFAFGVIYLNNLFNCMYDNKLKNMRAYYLYSKSHTKSITERKLYLFEDQFFDEAAKSKFTKEYAGKYEFVDRDTWESKLYEQEENAVIIYLLPRPHGYRYWFENYFIDTTTGQLMGKTSDMVSQMQSAEEKMYYDDVTRNLKMIKKASKE